MNRFISFYDGMVAVVDPHCPSPRVHDSSRLLGRGFLRQLGKTVNLFFLSFSLYDSRVGFIWRDVFPWLRGCS